MNQNRPSYIVVTINFQISMIFKSNVLFLAHLAHLMGKQWVGALLHCVFTQRPRLSIWVTLTKEKNITNCAQQDFEVLTLK